MKPQEWYCPNCGLVDRTATFVTNRYHTCPKLRGLSAPLLPAGVKAKVEAHDREDYVGQEMVQRDANGRPIMSIETTRDNGNDLIVFAPTATARVGDF